MIELLFIILLFLILLINPQICKNATFNSFHLWIESYLPNIFIYLVLSDLILNSKHFIKFLNHYKKNTIDDKSYFISLVAGIIPAASVLKETENNQSHNFCQIIRIAVLNPAFILIYANIFVENSIILMLILLMNLIFNAISFRLFNNNKIIPKLITENKSSGFTFQMLKSIEKNFLNVFKILGIMLFVNIIVELILFLNQTLELLPNKIIYFVCANLEIINGLNLLNSVYGGIEKILSITFAISFLGFSIHLQSLFLFDKKLKYFPFFCYNLIKSIIITLIIYPFALIL